MRKRLPAGAKPAKPRGGKARRRRARAERPDAARALGELTAFLRHAMGGLRGKIREAFEAIPDRHEELCTYSPETLCMALLGLFLLRGGSVNSADADRGCGSYARWLRAVLGKGPDDEGAGAPCGELLRHWFGRAPAKLVGAILPAALNLLLLRGKRLDLWRCNGCVLVAIDGTDREKCRKGTTQNGGERRVALVASVVTPQGKFPVMYEEMDQYDWEADKADCELRALTRLAPSLKDAFPRLAICLVGDALYACESVFALCRENGWHFIATFKEGRSPAVSREADELLRLSPDNSGPYMPEGWAARRRMRGGAQVAADGRVAWVERVDFTQPKGEERLLTVVECEEKSPMPYRGRFVTDLGCGSAAEASLLATAGRLRWGIESQNNVQKHNGYGLGHAFVNKGDASKNFFTFMLLATLLWEVFYKFGLRHWQPGCGKVSERKWVELIRALLISDAGNPWEGRDGGHNLKRA